MKQETFNNHWSEARMREHGLMRSAPVRSHVDFPVTVAAMVRQACEQHQDQEALVDTHTRYSYKAMFEAVENVAATLWSLGLRPGDRVGVSLGNNAENVLIFLAAQRLGLIWVGVNRALAAAEKLYLLTDSQAQLLLADQVTIEALKVLPNPPSVRMIAVASSEAGEWEAMKAQHSGERAPDVDIDIFAPAAIAYTSGTTGRPKGAVHSQWNMMLFVAMQGTWRDALRQPGARIGVSLPLATMNMFVLDVLPAFTSGGASIIIDKADTVGLARWIGREKVGVYHAVPAIALDLLTSPDVDPADLATLKAPGVGAAMVPDSLRQRFRERFNTEVVTGYGLTEAPSVVSHTAMSSGYVPASAGRALVYLEITIRDAEGKALAPGETGEVCVGARGDGPYADLYRPLLGYWRLPDATVEVLRGGVLHTGDVGRMTAEGELFIVDRKNDMIVRGGNNVYPAEIERVLSADSRVTACAVIGVADERLGQNVGALVQPAPGVDQAALLQDLKQAVARDLARYKQPALWAFAENFPRNPLDKIVKNAIRPPAQWLEA